MSRRLPAPPPPGPDGSQTPPKPADPPPAPVVDDELSEDGDWFDEDDEEDLALLDPDSWPDDDDEPTVPEGLLDETTDLGELPPLSTEDEDADADEDDPLAWVDHELPLEDDLTDLEAPDDDDLAVLPWSLDIELDGRVVPARVTPSDDRTTWCRPGPGGEDPTVLLRVRGVTVTLPVRLVDGPEEEVRLGRDVLVGRFLLRP